MDQIKIGAFLKQLRKEKGITQEMLAEQLGVSNRTVSRWETGNNMPDLDILIEIAEYYDVEISEIFYGERKSENMDKEIKDTMLKVADYTNIRNEKLSRNMFGISILGLIVFTAYMVIRLFGESWGVPDFLVSYLEGMSYGIMIVFVLYSSGRLNKVCEAKRRVLAKLKNSDN